MKLIVQVEPQALEEAKQRAARKISKQKKIPGFRPGKAPYSVILRTVGEATIIEDEDVERVLNDLRERQAVLTPVERPALETDQVTIKLSGERKKVKEG